jgi:hypothetical protein
MQQLHESVRINDVDFEENQQIVKLRPPLDNIKQEENEFEDLRTQNNKKFLIENGQEYYKSIKENFKTSLITKNNENDRIAENVDGKENENDENSQTVVGSVKEMAQILVNSIMTVAIDEVRETSYKEDSNESKKNTNDKLKGFRYLINSAKSKSPTPTSQTPLMNLTEKDQFYHEQVDSTLNDFNFNKSNSRLSYYKDYTQADIDTKEDKIDHVYGHENAEIRSKFLIEFQDEPPE